jgi:hypothetical protein
VRKKVYKLILINKFYTHSALICKIFYTLPHGRHTYGMANGVASVQKQIKGGKKDNKFKYMKTLDSQF